MADPSLLFWNSLGAKPKSEHMDKALMAEVRDPLWMLCRQWQFGEFRGEDAAAPVFAQIHYRQSFPAWISGRDGIPSPIPTDEPLNHWVETAPAVLDLSARMEIGQQWIKLVNREYQQEDQATVRDTFLGHPALAFTVPDDTTRLDQYQQATLFSNEPLADRLRILQDRRAIDGAKLLSLSSDSTTSLATTVLGEPNAAIDALGQKLLAWANRVYNYDIAEPSSWHAAQLEYQFSVGVAETEQQQLQLKAKEYAGKQLTWHQFAADRHPTSAEDVPLAITDKSVTQIPIQVNYIGMPKTRWWEMEDATVNFGNIKTSTTNPARLLFTQFNLIYGNDWFLLPLQVEIGSLTQVAQILVKDNFGFYTQVDPTEEDAAGNWRFLQMPVASTGAATSSSRWYQPAAAHDYQQSDPLELVHFARDQMANLVWGIEGIVSDHISKGVPGGEKANALAEFIRQLADPDTFTEANNRAELKYLLSNKVPENWIPFVPVRIGEDAQSRQIQLQRAAMPRITKGLPTQRIRPQTTLLRQGIADEGAQPYFIFEEEIPRAGVMVKGYWKRARWWNGKTFVWYAREKTIGRGEEASQLQFDYLVPME